MDNHSKLQTEHLKLIQKQKTTNTFVGCEQNLSLSISKIRCFDRSSFLGLTFVYFNVWHQCHWNETKYVLSTPLHNSWDVFASYATMNRMANLLIVYLANLCKCATYMCTNRHLPRNQSMLTHSLRKVFLNHDTFPQCQPTTLHKNKINFKHQQTDK